MNRAHDCQPPKRATRAAAASKPAAKTTSTRASRSRTKPNLATAIPSHGPQNDAEIRSAFRLFAIAREDFNEDEADDIDDNDDEEGVIRIPDVRRCLTYVLSVLFFHQHARLTLLNKHSALNLPKPPADFFDAEQTHLSWCNFLALAQTLRETQSDSPSGSSPLSSAPDEPMDDNDNEDDGEDEDEELDAAPVKRGRKKSNPSAVAASTKTKPKKTTTAKRRARVLDDDDHEHDEDDEKRGHHRNAEEEIAHAFALFTHNRYGQGDELPEHGHARITLADLKRIARELREDVDEKVLRMMIEEANGESGRGVVERGVGRGEFEGVMRRAGVLG